MEDQLKAILGSIYSTPSQSHQPPKFHQHSFQQRPQQAQHQQQQPRRGSHPPYPQAATDLELFTSDDFRMYCYKVVPCSIRGPHEWTTCGFCHPGEKATRRCPQKYSYTAIACPDLKKAGDCPRGEDCMFAHNVFEYWLHPTRYRTQMCSYGTDCKRSICFFAHDYSQLRMSEDLEQLQAIERELEGDTGFGFPTGSRWSSLGSKSGPGTPQGRAASLGAAELDQMRRLQPSMQHGHQLQASPRHTPGAGLAGQQTLLQAALRNAQYPSGSPAQANRALFDMGMPPAGSTPPSAPPVLSTTCSLLSPLPSLTSHDIDAQMEAAMKLLADLSVTKQQMLQQQQPQPQAQPQPYGGFGGWQAAAAAALQQQQPTGAAVTNPYNSPLHSRFSAPNQHTMPGLTSPLPSADLQQALMGLLPGLLQQLGSGAIGGVNNKQHPASAGTCSPPIAATRSLLSPAMLAGLTGRGLQAGGCGQLGMDTANSPARYSPVDVLSMHSQLTTSSVKSTGTISPRSSDGCRSPSPSSRSDDGEDALGPAALGLAGLGMGMGLGKMLNGKGVENVVPVDCGNNGSHPDELLLNSSNLIESLSQLVDEPTTAEMLPRIQELDKQLRQLSNRRSLDA